MRTQSLAILGPDGKPFASARQAEAPLTPRRWEAAETTRLNKAHWGKVNDQSINTDLADKLPILRSRAIYEAAQNPMVEGMIATFSGDVAGRNGPILQVLVDEQDEPWAEVLEEAWQSWWLNPDYRGRLGGVDFLKLWTRNCFTSGEFVSQQVTDADEARKTAGISLRLRTIHPRRIETPATLYGDNQVVMGVRQTEGGKAVEYYVAKPRQMGNYFIHVGEYERVPAADIIHEFITVEDDQVRGVPWLTTPLTAVADMRDFDAQVLDAARQAADMALYWYTEHADAPYLNVNETAAIERRTQSTGPPGWKPYALVPTQPAPNYVQYREERQREFGRPVNMPLMMVRLDASGHNYSSARFDGQLYIKGVQAVQGWLERRVLTRLLQAVESEARLARILPRRRPAKVEFNWIWPAVMGHVDPAKEATGAEIEMRTGLSSYSELVARTGKAPDRVIRQRARDNARLKAAGLAPVPGSDPAVTAAAIAAAAQEEKSDVPKTDDKK